jgi:hypothetical protein
MSVAIMRTPLFQFNRLIFMGPVALIAIAGWLYLIVLLLGKFL